MRTQASNTIELPLQLTEAAANKIRNLITNKKNQKLKFRIYITGGGCSGFKYGFIFDDKVNDGDIIIEKYGIVLVTDQISLQYLIGSVVDYIEELEGSRFIVINPNVKSTCGCGSSFEI